MASKNFKCDEPTWRDLAGTWSGISGVSKYVAGITAVEGANSVLQSAPSDVGGTFAFSYTVDQAQKLYEHWQDMQMLSNSIHYEASEKIDVPFTQRMEPVMRNIYDLSPKQFRTKKNFLFISCGSSLEEVLIGMVNTDEIKESYELLIEGLDNDVPDDTLEVAIEEADYWAQQFKEAEEIRLIIQNTIAEHEADWDTYTADEKLEVLNEYGIEIGKVLDERYWYEFSGHQDVFVRVDWNVNDPNYDPKSGAYAYTRSKNRDGLVFINQDALTNPDLYTLDFLLETVTHETRHQYQGQAKNDPDKFGLPQIYATDWLNDYTIDYWDRSWEIDARAFAGLCNIY